MAGFFTQTARVAQASFPGWGPSDAKFKLQLMRAAYAHRDAVTPFVTAVPGSILADVMAARPQTLGALVWPYQCAGWDAAERLARIKGHYDVTGALGAPWRFGLHEKLILTDLSERFAGLRLVIDQPKWLMREGGLAINLFVEDFRSFSLAFSLYRQPGGGLQAVVGGLQGRKRDGALDLYRDLTKALFGLRPRDFLFDVLRMICKEIGMDEIYAVTQAHRHHQHPFFGTKDLTPDYDAIWDDRGGERVDEMMYRFAVVQPHRDIETIKPNKRSLYRKRFAFLDELDAQIAADLSGLTPTTFVDL